jgi:hypothetical protein
MEYIINKQTEIDGTPNETDLAFNVNTTQLPRGAQIVWMNDQIIFFLSDRTKMKPEL